MNFTQMISAIDVHTAGKPTRIVMSGLPPILGHSMAEKKQYMRENLDYIRTLLMQEPRGHKDMFGAIIRPPISDRSQYGVIFMDNAGYIDMCGTGIIAITTALIEIGMIPPTEPETIVVFDTPAGLVESYARVQGNQVYEVSVANVSSFLYARDVEINLPDLGKVIIDVSFGGNFFAVAQARSLGISFHTDNITKLTEWGIMLKKAVNEKLQVQHPIQKHITTVELTAIYDRPEPARPFVNSIVVFGNGQVDRSPCGTGTSAIMATLYGKGELKLGVEFTSESLIGTSFRGKLLREVKVGNLTTVDPMFTGEAYITGIQQFVLDPNDPVKYGFVLG